MGWGRERSGTGTHLIISKCLKSNSTKEDNIRTAYSLSLKNHESMSSGLKLPSQLGQERADHEEVRVSVSHKAQSPPCLCPPWLCPPGCCPGDNAENRYTHQSLELANLPNPVTYSPSCLFLLTKHPSEVLICFCSCLRDRLYWRIHQVSGLPDSSISHHK